MSESEPPAPRAPLGEEIAAARARATPGLPGNAGSAQTGSALGIGFRIGIEMVAALCVGLAFGWVFDHFLGTRPWGLIVFFFLGSAAGIMNVFRATRTMGYGTPPGRRG